MGKESLDILFVCFCISFFFIFGSSAQAFSKSVNKQPIRLVINSSPDCQQKRLSKDTGIMAVSETSKNEILEGIYTSALQSSRVRLPEDPNQRTFIIKCQHPEHIAYYKGDDLKLNSALLLIKPEGWIIRPSDKKKELFKKVISWDVHGTWIEVLNQIGKEYSIQFWVDGISKVIAVEKPGKYGILKLICDTVSPNIQ